MGTAPALSSGMLVRLATPDDAATLASLATRTFVDAYTGMCADADIASYVAAHLGEEAQRAELRDPLTATLVGETDGAVMAYAQLRRSSGGAGVTGAAPVEIARFYVDRPWHGAGHAHTLMREALSWARLAGADVAWLGVWKRNARAIAFYSKWGFERVGEQTFVMGSDVQFDDVLALALRG